MTFIYPVHTKSIRFSIQLSVIRGAPVLTDVFKRATSAYCLLENNRLGTLWYAGSAHLDNVDGWPHDDINVVMASKKPRKCASNLWSNDFFLCSSYTDYELD